MTSQDAAISAMANCRASYIPLGFADQGGGHLWLAAAGRIDTEKITAHWEDMCRAAVSIHSGEVSAHDVTRMISRDGNPTPR